MKKRGFVFLETIVVLMVVTISISALLVSYSLISRKMEDKNYYDKVSDKYLLYSIMNLGTDDENSYLNLSNVAMSDDTCDLFLTSGKEINVFPSGECKKVFNKVGLKYLYVVDDINETLKSNAIYSISDTNSSSQTVDIFDNGAIEYMKTLSKCYDENVYNSNNSSDGSYYTVKDYYDDDTSEDKMSCSHPVKYIIGVFEKYGKYYYTSIEISDTPDISSSNP